MSVSLHLKHFTSGNKQDYWAVNGWRVSRQTYFDLGYVATRKDTFTTRVCPKTGRIEQNHMIYVPAKTAMKAGLL